MHSTSMGHPSVLRSIPSKDLIQQLFARFAPSVSIDWAQGKRKFDAALSNATVALFTTSPAEWNQITTQLEDIAIVCADRKTPERLMALMKGHIKADDYLLFTGENRSVQNGACWLLLNVPDEWQRIVLAAKAAKLRTKNTQVFLTAAGLKPDNAKVDDFARAVSELLFAKLNHGNHAHVEHIDDGETCRYFMSVNRYPNNVQHFDAAGQYAIRDNQTAENFMLEYGDGTLVIRCDYTVAIRRAIADSFARIILHTQAVEQLKGATNLTRFLSGETLPKPSNPSLSNVRLAGVTVSYETDGAVQQIMLLTDGLTDQRQLMQTILTHLNVAPQKVKVETAYFSLTVKKHDGSEREVSARLTNTGVCVNCRDRECSAIVRRYLTEVSA